MKARLAALLALALGASARADEGMWMPQQLPDLAARLEKLGFTGDARQFADLTGQPMGAVVSLGGCSASFVSPDGLIATNHHCVIGALQFNSTPERNLLDGGYVARSRGEELWNGPGARVYVTVSVTEVTDEITGGLEPGLGDAERGKLIERRVKRRTARCEKPGLRCTVASFFEGARWFEVGQLEIQDVRLVFAPPANVGNFGGETDNWMWPRHSGDFSFFRAYVGKDGSPRPHADDNVPYHPRRWLKVSPKGVAEDDLVFVAGYPGRTQRLKTYREVKEQLEWAYPGTVRRNRDLLAILERLSKESKETAIRVNPRVRGLANSMKNREGVLEGAARGGLLEKKAQDEKALVAWIEADAARKAEYGEALAALDRIQGEKERTRERDLVFQSLTSSSSLLSAARTVWRLADDRPKKDLDRDPAFQQREWPRLREYLERIERSLDLGADRALLRYALVEAAALPADQRIPPLDAAVGLAPGAPPDEAGRRIDAFLDRLYAGTKLADRKTRLELSERKTTKELAARKDTFLDLFAALRPFERQLREEQYARDGARSRVGPVYARALVARAGGVLAPDANGTLRVTYGVVKGVSPRDGLYYRPQTTLAGVLAKHRAGDEEFDVPAPVREAIRAQHARGTGPYVDPKLGDVPVDFLSSVDTTGGNSGSAVLNGAGELVGLLFDGTWETIASDFIFDAPSTRSIQVDSRYLLWFLTDVAKATNLLEELGAPVAVGAR
ncbi:MULTISPECIES: S46 family peptidase [Anaeromyxobacter]|uniref:S46 family peptidase n=1 Tax=Anaeromyxobacter TaxID=161492 RepID=UPI001F57DF00|nr:MULTISPECIES: S46 family peptidase [unclassified Anaeromyxobacter]